MAVAQCTVFAGIAMFTVISHTISVFVFSGHMVWYCGS